MKNKKSQAALEFLTTYGWAILVVTIMIGALAYFGVINPKSVVKEQCITSGYPFECVDYSLKTGSNYSVFKIIIKNVGNDDIYLMPRKTTLIDVGNNIKGRRCIANNVLPPPSVIPISPEEKIEMGCSLEKKYSEGEIVKIRLELQYTKTKENLPTKAYHVQTFEITVKST